MIAGALLWSTLLITQSVPDGTKDPQAESLLLERRLEAVRKAPTDPAARLELGMAYIESEEYEFALSELVEAIRLNPENRDNLSGKANFELGTVLIALDRAALAVNAYREALRLGFKEAGVYAALAQALARQAKYAEAIEQYREAIRLAPELFEAHAGLALALEATGRLDEALSQFEAALRLAPSSTDHGIEALKQRLAKLKDRQQL
jgi:tetratricopeptide (TPR) repeat protein